MIKIRRSAASLAAELDRKRAVATDEINALTVAARVKYITNIAGQEMMYLEKEKEALAFLALEREPADLADFPFLEAEVAITGRAARAVAELITATAAAWRRLGPRIEALRRGATEVIRNAETEAEIAQMLADFREAIGEF